MKKYLFIAVLLSIACAGPFRGSRVGGDGPVQFQTILSGAYSLADTFSIQLIKSEDKWEDVWLIAKGRINPLPDKPTVDFDRQYVIAAFLGERSSSGYRIEIESLELAGRTLNVYVTKYETPGMLTVITSPFFLARVPKGSYKLEVISKIVR
ncbi:MAG: protease complex subunit PrcB family protein [candidate division Zixibacteria bacterium]